MDAYDLSDMMKKMWADRADKASGDLTKPKNKISVVINTNEGYRQVIGLFWNREINKIEMVLDND